MSTNSDKIAIIEIKAKLSKDKTLEENMKTAMTEAHNHWLICQYHNEKTELMVAVAAVGDYYGINSPEFERIKQEMQIINAIHFTPSNVPVDWNQLLLTLDKDHEKIGIAEMWQQVVKA